MGKEERSEVLAIRLSRAERRLLDAAAAVEHLATGTWLRQLGLRAAETKPETKPVKR